jgi:hypothetical protein
MVALQISPLGERQFMPSSLRRSLPGGGGDGQAGLYTMVVWASGNWADIGGGNEIVQSTFWAVKIILSSREP